MENKTFKRGMERSLYELSLLNRRISLPMNVIGENLPEVIIVLAWNFFEIIKANNIGLGLKECDSFANICTMNVVDQSILVTIYHSM